MSQGINRRQLFKWGLAGAAALAAPSVMTPSATAATSQFARHTPGRVFVGVSSARSINQDVSHVGRMGLKRTFHGWLELSGERSKILQAHSSGCLPWISFASVGTSRGGWPAIARGKFDADIRARARHYASLNAPVIVTFCHEPHNKMEGTRADWAAAFIRIHDVMKSETGLRNVIHAPIIGEWEFNPVNKSGDPRAFLPDGVLGRCHFLGTDIYQPDSGRLASDKLPVIYDSLNRWGFSSKMIGIGEIGASNRIAPPRAAVWWNDAWSYIKANRNRMAAVAYYDSARNSKSWVYWPLDESSDKRDAFRAAVSSTVAVRL